MAQWLKALAVCPENSGLIPRTTWKFTTVCNSRGPNTLTSDIHAGKHQCTKNKNKSLKKISSRDWKDGSVLPALTEELDSLQPPVTLTPACMGISTYTKIHAYIHNKKYTLTYIIKKIKLRGWKDISEIKSNCYYSWGLWFPTPMFDFRGSMAYSGHEPLTHT